MNTGPIRTSETEDEPFPRRARASLKTSPKIIALIHLLIMMAAIWSITITSYELLFFSLLSLEYLSTTFIGIADTALRKPVVDFWIQNTDAIGVITSLPLISTQLCMLANVPKKLALCNLMPAIFDLVVLLLPSIHMELLSDRTLALQIFVIIYCAQKIKCAAAAVLAFVYSFLYYGPDDPDQSMYGPSICMAMFLMGTIAITYKELLRTAPAQNGTFMRPAQFSEKSADHSDDYAVFGRIFKTVQNFTMPLEN